MLNPYRRSLLYVPGSSARMLEKAETRACDTVIVDLEDAVAPAEKEEARIRAGRFLDASKREKELFIRVNDVGSSLFEEDVRMAAEHRADAIVLPKACSHAVAVADWLLCRLDSENTVGLIPLVETAQGLSELRELLLGSGRIIAVQFGAEDFTRDMEIERTKTGEEVRFARQIIGLLCRSRNVQAIDTPYVDYRDEVGLESDSLVAKICGFGAKTCIHPAQVDTVNRFFMPGGKEISFAQRVMQEAQREENRRLGAFPLDGKMVDAPVIARAEGVLARAERYGLIDNQNER